MATHPYEIDEGPATATRGPENQNRSSLLSPRISIRIFSPHKYLILIQNLDHTFVKFSNPQPLHLNRTFPYQTKHMVDTTGRSMITKLYEIGEPSKTLVRGWGCPPPAI